jgi:two-component system, cell cycle sensor histidine kinase and response regulator CckA
MELRLLVCLGRTLFQAPSPPSRLSVCLTANNVGHKLTSSMQGKRLPLGSALIWSALATLALQVFDLALLGMRPPGPLISQALQAVSASLSGVACILASRRSLAFARSFWQLSSVAFFIWAVAQTIGTYHLYVVTLQPQVGPRGIILYFFSFTPLFAVLFLSPDARDQDTRWESFLDFLQILIITATFYLLFLHVPWWRLSETEWVSRRAATVNLRNVLLSAGFVFRILTTRSKQRRELYARVGSPMVLYSIGFWLGKRGISIWSNHLGSWFDLGWTLPFLLIVLLAEGWKEQPAENESGNHRGYVPIVLTFLLSLSLPAVVVWLIRFRGSVSDPEAYLICGAAASVVICFFSRLMLTQYRQHRTFELLQSSEQRYRSLFERNLAGVFRTTPDGRYLDCNDAYARIYGYASREEALSGNSVARDANPSDWADRMALLRREGSLTNMEVPQYREDGSFIWILHNVTLMKDEQGNEFIEGTVVDVTDRRLAEAKILDWKNRYEAAVLASGQIIYDWNPYTNRVTFGGNFETILGYAVEEIAAETNRWRELIHSDDLERYASEVDRVIAIGREPLHIEYRVRKKNGHYATIKDEAQFILNNSGKVDHMVGFITDVTEQRALESQLRQSQKMEAVGRLAGGLAHDFNNLLTVIKGYSRMVLDDPRQEEKVRGSVEHIDGAAERAASLIRHLLAFSRKQVLQPIVIDLNALMMNLDKMLRRLIGEDIEVVTIASQDLGFVNADPGQIEQVIMNLVVNARDAMPNGGKLTLETANIAVDEDYAREHEGVRPGRYVMLAVSDTGSGMDPQTAARIFEPFFTTKELGRGTGLGLSTVYGIVKQSGGHIWVYSELGRGTTFKIYFARVEDPAEIVSQNARPTVRPRGNESILVVEDDEQVRELTHSILTTSGYTVLVAENEPSVAKICEQHANDIDLLLTDVVMPGINGREVAIRVSARWPNIKIMYMSGYTENAIVHHGVLDVDTFFLAKPFTPSALTNKVREVLDHDRRTR